MCTFVQNVVRNATSGFNILSIFNVNISAVKNVLVIAYYFPPSGGPGVQRVLKHVQYLRDFGWNPIVLTVANGDFPARDESLLAKIPSGIHVERTEIYEPYTLYRKFTGKTADTPIDVNTIKKDSQGRTFTESVAEFIRATFFIPDARVGWLATAVPAGLRLIKEYNIQAIYNSSPPYTTALIARQLKRRTGLRWVTGFRDPWTGFLTSPKRWMLPATIDRALEHSVFREADAIECAWEGIINDIRGKFPDLPSEKFHHVPNGFDALDYPAIETKGNQRFTITYTGSMYGRRTPISFFAALELLIQRGELKATDFHARFIGRFGAEIHAMFEQTSFQGSLEIIGYMPHEESIRQLLLSDALLLVVDESKESEKIVPGKVYEYIGAGKPIIAVAPPNGAIADLLRETQTGRIAHQSEVEQLADIIRDYYVDWKHGTSIFAPNRNVIDRYERKNAAGQLAALLVGQ